MLFFLAFGDIHTVADFKMKEYSDELMRAALQDLVRLGWVDEGPAGYWQIKPSIVTVWNSTYAGGGRLSPLADVLPFVGRPEPFTVRCLKLAEAVGLEGAALKLWNYLVARAKTDRTWADSYTVIAGVLKRDR